jgi:16S rRNA (uracil1498-N3)-methyltransferase
MTLPRFFISGSIILDQPITLPDDVGHHLAKVLRLREGDGIVLFNGEGGEYRSQVAAIHKKKVEVFVNEFSEGNRAPALPVNLGMCVLKRDAMDRVIAKAVELGIESITPLISDHCSVSTKVIRNRQAHWQQVIITACEQCGLNRLPQLHPAAPLIDWLEDQTTETRIVALPNASPLPKNPVATKDVSLLVGPEGGFSEVEVTTASGRGFQSATFGQRVLRGETAPVVALAVIHRLWGDY